MLNWQQIEEIDSFIICTQRMGTPGLVAIVVQLRDLILDQIVDLLGLGRFLHLDIGGRTRRR